MHRRLIGGAPCTHTTCEIKAEIGWVVVVVVVAATAGGRVQEGCKVERE